MHNNLWNNPRPYFALQNSHGNAKNFFEIYRKFGHAPEKGSAEHNLKLQKTDKSFFPSGLYCMTQLKTIRKNSKAHQCYVICNLPNLLIYSCSIIQLVYCYDSRREETRIVGTVYRTTTTD
jgi:hypothetical protein